MPDTCCSPRKAEPASACCAPKAERPSCGCGSKSGVEAVPAAGSPDSVVSISTPAGRVPVVGTRLTWADALGAWRVRWSIGRMSYAVEPGLYAVGEPAAESPVLVSANYKLSFDRLRSELGGRDAWILVVDTRGINVWCSAGKGTFSAEEIVRRVEAVGLSEIVSHRTLIVPQLAAPGVNAHEGRRLSGFQVVYGPIRAEDLPRFLDAGMKATPEMRRVRFPLRERVALIPVELVMAAKYALVVAVCLLVLGGLGASGYSLARLAEGGVRSALLFLGVYLFGVAVPPALLPWLPGRAFATKGAVAGLVFGLAVAAYMLAHPGFGTPVEAAAWLLMAPAVASFLAMNFTGASTYTSLSGVQHEMAYAVPAQAIAGALGALLWLVARFV